MAYFSSCCNGSPSRAVRSALALNDDVRCDFAGGDVLHFGRSVQGVINPTLAIRILPLWMAFFRLVAIPTQRSQNRVDEGVASVFLQPIVQIRTEVIPFLYATAHFNDRLPYISDTPAIPPPEANLSGLSPHDENAGVRTQHAITDHGPASCPSWKNSGTGLAVLPMILASPSCLCFHSRSLPLNFR